MTRSIWMAAIALAAGLSQAVVASDVPVGSRVDTLTFKDMRYLPRSLDDLGEAEGYCFVFITNTCPLAQRYMSRIQALHDAFKDDGIVFAAINVGPDESIVEVAYHGLEYEATFALLKDVDGSATAALGATRTPEAVLLDRDRVIRYRGRIDDQFRLGGVRPEATRSDLRLAIEQLLDGDEIEVAETVAEGCLISAPATPEPDDTLTYYRDVAPITYQNCLPCHRPNGGAPFGMNTYRKVAARGAMIGEVVAEGRMPPWYAHPAFGEFHNDRRMTAAEKRTIAGWIAAGMPEGDPADAPAMPEFPDSEWAFEPDVVIQAKEIAALPATGYIPYRYIFLPHEFTEDTYVQSIQIKPTNAAVLHHANLFYTTGKLSFNRAQNFLTGVVPGGLPAMMEPGQAMMIPKGATLGLQVHYVTTGKLESDRLRVALRYPRVPVQKRIRYKILDDDEFAIPPFDPAHRVTQTDTIERNASLMGLFAHMHLRGRDMTFRAYYPDGSEEVLLSLPNYNFDWQLAYLVDDPGRKIPAGTEIEVVAHFDNSAFNPYNPAPEEEITEGPQTVDEMMQGFVFYTYDDEALNLAIDPNTGHAVGPAETELATNAK